MRVPDTAGMGTVKVEFSFDAWKEGHVAHSTIEIPLARPKPEEREKKK